MTRGDELKDLIIFSRQMNWQYQLSDYTDEALKSIQRSVNIARKELINSLELRDILQLEELNNLTFGIQAALHDDIAAAAQIAGKASYVEYNNIQYVKFSADSKTQLTSKLLIKCLGSKYSIRTNAHYCYERVHGLCQILWWWN